MVTPAALILLALWILGALYSDVGPYIHLLFVAAVVLLAFQFFKGHRAKTTLKR